MIASVRIARFIADTLELPLCWDMTIADEPLDVLIIVNGAYAFSGNELLGALGRAIEAAGRVVWIQNDYTIIPPKDVGYAESPFRKAFRNRAALCKCPVDYWTTIENMSRAGSIAPSGHKIGTRSAYVNWNALTFNSAGPMATLERSMSDWMVYYGSFRKGREPYFDRYFEVPHVKTVISSPSRKFEDKYSHEYILHDDRFDDVHTALCQFGLGLYLEDKKSHKEFHSPANRFYEMLSAGVAIIFQPEAIPMFTKAGFFIDNYCVRTGADIPPWMERRDAVGYEQQHKWFHKAQTEHDALAPILQQLWEKCK